MLYVVLLLCGRLWRVTRAFATTVRQGKVVRGLVVRSAEARAELIQNDISSGRLFVCLDMVSSGGR